MTIKPPYFLLLLALLISFCGSDGDKLKSIEEIEDAINNASVEFTMHHTRFDLDSGSFEELAAPSTQRNLASLFVVNNRIYYLGGIDEQGNYSADVERYNSNSDTWEALPNHPNPGLAFYVVARDRICGIGGFQRVGEPIRQDVDCFDTESDTWSSGSQIPVRYGAYYPVAHNDSIYIFGGLDRSLNPINQAWKYSPEDDNWEQLAQLPFGFSLGGVAPYEDKIYLVGGYKEQVTEDHDSVAKDSDMLVYDIAENSWETGPDMPNPRLLYGTAEVEGRIAVFLGISGRVPLLEYFDPDAGEWSAASNPETMPRGLVFTHIKQSSQLYFFTILNSGSDGSGGGELLHYDIVSDQWASIGQRSTELETALFSGVAVDTSSLHFIGAHTQLLY